MPESSVSSPAIYQLRVALRGVSPLKWRRLFVVSETSLAELHDVLQTAFDWSGEHLAAYLKWSLGNSSEWSPPQRCGAYFRLSSLVERSPGDSMGSAGRRVPCTNRTGGLWFTEYLRFTMGSREPVELGWTNSEWSPSSPTWSLLTRFLFCSPCN